MRRTVRQRFSENGRLAPAVSTKRPRPPRAQSSDAHGTKSAEEKRRKTYLQAADLGSPLERVTRIELALSAWEADVLPLNYTRARRRSYRCRTRRHSTSCWAPGARAVGLPRVSGAGSGCGVRELGRTVVVGNRFRVWPEGRGEHGSGGAGCRLEGRPFHPLMWAFVVRSRGRQVDCSDAALGEGTLGLDGTHRRPLCRWAHVQHRFVPDAAGRAARSRTADALSAVRPAAQCRAGAGADGARRAAAGRVTGSGSTVVAVRQL